MFHWICPECGQEIPPTVKACPVCEPPEVAPQPLPKNLGPAVQNGSIPPEAAKPADASVKTDASVSIAASVSEDGWVSPVALLAAPAAPVPIPEPAANIPEAAAQVAVLVQPAIPPKVQVEAPAELDPSKPVQAPLFPPEQPLSFADRLTALADQLHAGYVPYRRAEETAPVADRTSNAIAASEQVIEIPSVRLLNAPPQPMLLPEPAPPSMARPVPPGTEFQIRPASQTFGARVSVEPVPSAAATAVLPVNSVAGPGPKLGALTDYKSAAERTMRFVAPSREVKGAAAIAPKQTLPGPAIPRELTSLQAAGLTPVSLTRPRKIVVGTGSWMVSFLVMAGLLTVGFLAVLYLPGMLSNAGATPNASATTPKQVVEDPPAETTSVAAHPLARSIEVTGFRFLVDYKGKSEIHYLVVNHTNGSLGGLTVFVTLRPAKSKPGQAPLSKFSFRAPNLAPYEAREMTSPIEHVSKPINLPEWQEIAADVEVGQ